MTKLHSSVFCSYYQNHFAKFSLLWHQTVSIRLNWGGFTWLSSTMTRIQPYNNPIVLFHNHISCLMFPADSRRRFSPLPVERSVRVSSRRSRALKTGFAFRLVLSQSTVHVLTRVTDGDHHHSTEVLIIGGATWKLNRPVNSRSIKHVSTVRCLSILTNTRGFRADFSLVTSSRLFWRSIDLG